MLITNDCAEGQEERKMNTSSEEPNVAAMLEGLPQYIPVSALLDRKANEVSFTLLD
jgi:hypothetical protein